MNIQIVNKNDIISGRGNTMNSHDGNMLFRKFIKSLRVEYVAAGKQEKKIFSQEVVRTIKSLNPPGRFVVQSQIGDDVRYEELDEKKAIDKTRQALREGAPAFEKGIQDGTIVPKRGEVVALVAEAAITVYGPSINRAMSEEMRKELAVREAAAKMCKQSPHEIMHQTDTVHIHPVPSQIIEPIDITESCAYAASHKISWMQRNSLYLAELDDRKDQSNLQSQFAQAIQALDDDDDMSIEETISTQNHFASRNIDHNSCSLSSQSMALDLSVLLDDDIDNDKSTRLPKKNSLARRSMKMSLLMRQSLIGSFSFSVDNDGEDCYEGQEIPSRRIPDVFNSSRNRRRSTITESTEDLLKTFFGNETVNSVQNDHGRRSIMLESILEPIDTSSILLDTQMDDREENKQQSHHFSHSRNDSNGGSDICMVQV